MIYDDTTTFGYWFYNETQTGGHWVNEDSTDSGFWEQDYDIDTTGTWRNMNYTQYGTWYTDSEDSTIMHIVHYCEDTNNGEVDSSGTGCSEYAYDWCSSTDYNTEAFNAQEMCCICGGGNINDYTTGSGLFLHIDGSTGIWTVSSDGSSGDWSRDDGSDSGTWTYDDGYTTIGTW